VALPDGTLDLGTAVTFVISAAAAFLTGLIALWVARRREFRAQIERDKATLKKQYEDLAADTLATQAMLQKIKEYRGES
jgi:hypothetical protein